MKKTMNKVIAAIMMLTITTTVPAMAGNKKHHNVKNDRVVVVVDKKNASHFDALDRAYRPAVKSCTFRVSRHDSHRKVVARTERMRGVMNTKWNPRTRELTVIYDAKLTSARLIMHSVA